MRSKNLKKHTAIFLVIISPSMAILLALVPSEAGDRSEYIAYVCLEVFLVLTSLYAIAELAGWATKIREAIISDCDAVNIDNPNKVRWRSSFAFSLMMFFLFLVGAMYLFHYAWGGGERTFYLLSVFIALVSYHYLTEMINAREICIADSKLKLSSGPLFSMIYFKLEYEYTPNSKLIFKEEITRSSKGVTVVNYRFFIKNDSEDRSIDVNTDNLDQAMYIRKKLSKAVV